MRISDWSSDVCSSDLKSKSCANVPFVENQAVEWRAHSLLGLNVQDGGDKMSAGGQPGFLKLWWASRRRLCRQAASSRANSPRAARWRSEEHTSELQSLMRISYAVFCLKKKKQQLAKKQ